MADEQSNPWFWRLKALGNRIEENNAALNQSNNQHKSNIQSNNQSNVVDEEPEYRLDQNSPFGNEFLPSTLGRMQLPEGIDPDQAMKALTRFQGGKMVWNPKLRKYLKAYESGDTAALEDYNYGQGQTWKDAYDIDQGVYDEGSGYGTAGAVNLSDEDKEDIENKEKNLSLMQIAAPHIGSFAQGLKDYYAEGGHEPYQFQFFGNRGRDEE
jgi:hypothetical protein